MVPKALGIPVLEGGEAPQPAVLGGPDFCAVGGPAHIGCIGDDTTVVGFGRHYGRAVRREQVVVTHQTQDAVASDAVAAEVTQASEDLAMAFAGEGRGREIGANQREQRGVIEHGFRAAFARRDWCGRVGRHERGRRVVGRAWEVPRSADALHAVNLACRNGSGGAHCRDLRPAKGPDFSHRARSSSTSMLSSPIRRLASSRRS